MSPGLRAVVSALKTATKVGIPAFIAALVPQAGMSPETALTIVVASTLLGLVWKYVEAKWLTVGV